MKFQDLFAVFIIFCCVQGSNVCIHIQNVATITMESQCNGSNNQSNMHGRCRMKLVQYYTWIELMLYYHSQRRIRIMKHILHILILFVLS